MVCRGAPLATPETIRHGLSFVAQKGDILEVSYPRSGSHWVQYIIQDPATHDQRSLCELCARTFHCAWKSFNPEAKYVYVARNPWDVSVSLYHHKEHSTISWRPFLSGSLPYGCYFEHLVTGYSLKDEPNVLFLTYEELQRDVREMVVRLSSFIGERYLKALKENSVDGQKLLDVIIQNSRTDSMRKVLVFDLTENPYPEVDEFLKSLEPSTKAAHAGDTKRHELVRNGKVGQWKEYFSPEQLRRMEAAISEKTISGENVSLSEVPDAFLIFEDFLDCAGVKDVNRDPMFKCLRASRTEYDMEVPSATYIFSLNAGKGNPRPQYSTRSSLHL
ncbi:hypothetical protein MTO96_039235 [Rhipicephalus appendiculatus]